MFNGLTNIGKEYIAKCLAENKPITFTKVKIGDGLLDLDENAELLTDVKSLKKEVEILDKAQEGELTTLTILLDNSDIEVGYYPREIGIYVTDEGVEKLYWYINDGLETQWLCAANKYPIKFKQIINLMTTNLESVIVNWSGKDLFVDREFVEEKIREKVRTYEIPTVTELQSRKNLKVGDIIEVLGYYTAGDGAGHKRMIKETDDGSGVQLNNKLWANIVHNGEVNVSWFGAKKDYNDVDKIGYNNTLVFNKALSYVKSISNKNDSENLGNLLSPILKSDFGKYYFEDTIQVDCDIDFSQSTFLFKEKLEEKPCIKIGDSTYNLMNMNIKLPNLFNTNVAVFTNSFLYGVQIINVMHSNIEINQIQGFRNGLYLLGDSKGFSYNNIRLGIIIFCEKGLIMESKNNGYCNETLFLGGRITCTKRNMVFIEAGSNSTFVKPSIESGNVEYNIEFINTSYITFLSGRFEGAGARKILFNTTREYSNNSIMFLGGYGQKDLKFDYIGEFKPSGITQSNGNFLSTTSLISQKGGLTVVHTDTSKPNEYVAKLGADGLSIKRTVDKFDKLKINNDGAIYIGNGTEDIMTDPNTAIIRKATSQNLSISLGLFSNNSGNLGTYAQRWGTVFCNEINQASPKALDTPYYTEKMQQEGVKNDFTTYMDEKTAYDKQQRQIEQDRQLAYQEALKTNPNLTYEEFLSIQPATLSLQQEPQPSQALQAFMKKYL